MKTINKRKNFFVSVILLFALVFSSCSSSINLTLDANGGKFKDGEQIFVIKTDGKTVAELPDAPIKEGYSFIGWYLDKEGNKSAEELLSKAITTTVTLYAKWGYAITFNSNGGSETNSIIDVGGAEISAPDEPEKTGYVFSGWFTDDGTFEDEFIFETMPQQNITLYAKWELYNIGLSFTLINNDSEYEVSCGTCQDEEIIIPAQYQGKPVTSISDGAFEDNSKIISAILPDTIKNIGNRAFRFRKKLEQVNIPESVESIGDSAFEYCEKLTSVMISKKVSHIGSHAFAYCKEVTSFTVNEDNQNFKSVEGNLYSKDGTKLIQYAAKNQKTYFEIPENVTIIANCAFTNVVNLRSLVIPNTIVKMGDNQIGSYDCVFHSSRDITLYSEYQKDDIPSGWLQSWYGDSPVVWGCELSADKRRVLSFTKTGNNPEKQSFHYLLNNPPSYIGDYVFMGWFKEPEFINKEVINLVYFNNGNKYYAKWIANDDLTDFELYWHRNKDMFFEIWNTTENTYKIKDLRSELNLNDAAQILYHDGFMALEEKAVLIFECSDDDYDKVYEYACANNYVPQNYIKLPNTNVYVTDTYSLYNILSGDVKKADDCYYSKDDTVLIRMINTEITEYTVPDTVTKIGSLAFTFCSKLNSIDLGNNIISIGSEAFSYCSNLSSLTLPDSLESIECFAFRATGAVFTISENNQHFKTIDGNLYSKDGTVLKLYAQGKTDTVFIIPDSVTSIGDFAFAYNFVINNLVIGTNVTSIGDYAFFNNYIEEIIISENIISIGENVFYDYYGGKTIYVEASEPQSGWCEDWLNDDNTVIWNCTLSDDKTYVHSITKTADIIEINAPYRAGYTFEGWYDSEDYSGDKFDNIDSNTPDGTYYAKWAEIE